MTKLTNFSEFYDTIQVISDELRIKNLVKC
jgi:hypothetical protein